MTWNRRIAYLLYDFADKKRRPAKDFEDIAGKDPIEAVQLYSSNTAQAFMYLVDFLWSNHRLLLESLLSTVDSGSFIYISWMTIPSLFSFFSSKESTEEALKFYISAIDILPKEALEKFMIPFFQISACFPYFEKVFQKTFWENFMTSVPTELLVDHLIKHAYSLLHFLPASHIKFLNTLKQKRTDAEMVTFIARVLLHPQIVYMIFWNPFQYLDPPVVDLNAFPHVLFDFVSNDLPFPQGIQILHEIPNNFVSSNGRFFFFFCMCQRDISVLLKLKIQYPSYITQLSKIVANDGELPSERPFIFKYFPHAYQSIVPQPDPKIFPDVPNLDLLITLALEVERSNSLIELSKKFLDHLAPTVAMSHALKLDEPVWDSLSRNKSLRSIKIWKAIIYLYTIERPSLYPHIATIKTLERRFKKLLNQKKVEVKCPKNMAVWYFIGIASIPTTKSSFLSRFVILNILYDTLLEHSTDENHNREIIHFAYVAYDAVWVLRTVLYMQATAFQQIHFLTLDKKLVDKWKLIVADLFTLISNDSQLLSDFIRLSSGDLITPSTDIGIL